MLGNPTFSRERLFALSWLVLFALLTVVGCGSSATPTPTTAPAAQPSPTATPTATPTAAPSPTATAAMAASPTTMAMTPSAGMGQGHSMMTPGAGAATPSVNNEFRAGALVVRNVWARPATQSDGLSAVYMVIENTGDQPDRLLHAHSDVAQTIELHEAKMENGVMKMQPVEGIDVPAHGSVELKPGGLHVMLIGLTRDLNPGDTVELELHFEQAGHVAVQAVVQKP